MAKAKKRTGKKKAAGKRNKKPARRKPAARHGKVKRKPSPARTAVAAPPPRPVVIPGAWPFPMGGKP